MTQPLKPKQFFIDENTGIVEKWEDHWDSVLDAPRDEGQFHVIEHSAFQKAVDELKYVLDFLKGAPCDFSSGECHCGSSMNTSVYIHEHDPRDTGLDARDSVEKSVIKTLKELGVSYE